jgi:hypothetical protein
MVLVEAPPGWAVTQDSGQQQNDKLQESGVRSQKAEADTHGSDFGDRKSGVKQQPSSVKNQESAISNLQLVASDSGTKNPELGPSAAPEKSSPEKSSVWKDLPSEFAPETAAVTAQAAAPEFSSSALSAADAVFQPAPLAAEMAAVHGWPRWFWPSVAAAIVLGVLVFSLRLMFWGGASAEPVQINAVAPNTSDQTSAESIAVPTTNFAPAADAPANQHPTPLAAPTTVASGESSSGSDSPAMTNSTPTVAEQSKGAEEPTNAGNPSNGIAADTPTVQTPAAADVSPGETKSVPATSSANQSADSNSSENSSLAAPQLPIPSTDDSSTKSKAADVAASDLPPSGEHQPAPRTLKRVPARTVNMNARLADSVPEIDVQGQPLVDFLELISAMSTVPITLDVDAILDLGQSAASPIQLHLADASVADVLQTALEPLRLGYQLRDGQLIVGYPPQERLRQVRYNIADLVGDDSAALGELGAVVRRMVAPASWQQVGGKATMVAGKGVLLVEQMEPAHAQILNFCEKLRVARGLPLKSRYDPSRFVLNTREDKAQELLAKPISANFAAPTPLADAIKWLRQATGAVIVIDHESLAREGTSAQSECEALAVIKPLAKLLDDLTASADLAWRAMDERTIEITSHPAALARMDVEFYPARNLATDATAGEKLIAQIKAKIEPQLWGDAADKLADLGAIHFDSPSGALIVRAPQRVQSQVEAELAAQRGRK